MNICIKISFIFLIQVTGESYIIFQGLQKMIGKGITAANSPYIYCTVVWFLIIKPIEVSILKKFSKPQSQKSPNLLSIWALFKKNRMEKVTAE